MRCAEVLLPTAGSPARLSHQAFALVLSIVAVMSRRWSRKEDRVTFSNTADASSAGLWTTGKGPEGFVALSEEEPYVELLSDPETFFVTQRAGGYGPVIVAENRIDADMDINCGALRSTYRVNVPWSGHFESTHRGSSLIAGPGTAVLYQPEGDAGSRWVAGSRLLSVRIDRRVVEDALSDTLGRQLTSQIDFTSCISTGSAITDSWVNMLSLFAEQLFRADSVLTQPMVGLPFVDSLVHGLLLAAEHPYRSVVAGEAQIIGPRPIRTAVEVIEEEAHLPLTVSAIAARCHVSVRALQQDFRRYVGTSPMAYLREVRLRRAHQSLLESDPSVTSVASVAYQWGFTNFGRFAAAHTARYDEPPAATLRRRAHRRIQHAGSLGSSLDVQIKGHDKLRRPDHQA
jgi:AraC-like DNA-binding protein